MDRRSKWPRRSRTATAGVAHPALRWSDEGSGRPARVGPRQRPRPACRRDAFAPPVRFHQLPARRCGQRGRTLFDWLTRQFGREHVFLDTDKTGFGADFAQVLRDRLAATDVVLGLIGPQWLNMADARGRRLDRPGDYVRMEIVAALHSGKRVIPVLVGGAVMPPAQQLPAALADLAKRIERWTSDIRDAARRGWCCSGGRVYEASEDRCRGRLETSERAARYQCEQGWCCIDHSLVQTDGRTCKLRRGLFHTDKGRAENQCHVQ